MQPGLRAEHRQARPGAGRAHRHDRRPCRRAVGPSTSSVGSTRPAQRRSRSRSRKASRWATAATRSSRAGTCSSRRTRRCPAASASTSGRSRPTLTATSGASTSPRRSGCSGRIGADRRRWGADLRMPGTRGSRSSWWSPSWSRSRRRSSASAGTAGPRKSGRATRPSRRTGPALSRGHGYVETDGAPGVGMGHGSTSDARCLRCSSRGPADAGSVIGASSPQRSTVWAMAPPSTR